MQNNPVELIKISEYILKAQQTKHPKHRHVAIVWHEGNLVAWSNNTQHEHAERRAIAIANIAGYTKKLTLISVAINKSNKLKMGMPCPPCYTYCKSHGVTCIFYSTNKQTIERMK